ncbi:MAG: acyl-CoA dehydrogenase family protein [Planctomycetes bacterium]|nr:acyl-CoA dehydrogenase family protein [Planctomycetota bacterium]
MGNRTRFRGVDYFDVDSLLSEEERLVRDSVRAFVDDRLLAVIERHYREGTFPLELLGEIAGLGLLGANIQGYGCAGVNNVAYGLMMQELERGDSGVRSFASVQGALCMYPIHAFGSPEQRERWLPRMAAGEVIGCFGLTEPDFGSNPGGMLTRLEERGDHFQLSGTKRWITNGSMAHLAVVWAKLDGVVHGVLVERGSPGFTSKPIEGKFSLRASDTSELIFEDTPVPRDNLLPGTDGLKSALMCLNQARYGIAWGAVGSAMASYDCALEYARSRVQFERPIAGYQLVQGKLVQMLTDITAAQLLCLRLGRLKDEHRLRHTQVCLAKRNNVHMALGASRVARDILGASGICDEYPVFRHMCNLESVYTYEGTHDIHTLIVGEDITGLAAYS